MLKIVTGKVSRAQRVGLYGPEGIGKSSLAAQFEKPLFLDLESGTDQLDVRRVSGIASWEELLSTVREVCREPEVCRSLVVDTADRAEQLCIAHICQKFKQPGLESFGYGRGYTFLAEEWGRLLSALDEVIARGIHVILIAHARQRKIELPDQTGSFDHWEMKLSKQVAPLVKEWVDMLLFLNFQTYVITTETNSRKATGGARRMFTSHSPTFDAKNRHNLPEVMDLDYAGIANVFSEAGSAVAPVPSASPSAVVPPVSAGPSPAAAPPASANPSPVTVSSGTTVPEPIASPDSIPPLDALRALMARDGVSEEQLRQLVARKGKYDASVPLEAYEEDFISGWCIPHWPDILNLISAEKSAHEKENKK